MPLQVEIGARGAERGPEQGQDYGAVAGYPQTGENRRPQARRRNAQGQCRFFLCPPPPNVIETKIMICCDLYDCFRQVHIYVIYLSLLYFETFSYPKEKLLTPSKIILV